MNKIAWLHSHFLRWAGATKFVYEVARRIHHFTPVDMIVERCSPQVRAMYDAAGMEVIEINSRSSTSMLYWSLLPLYLRRDIRRVTELKGRYSAFVTSMFPMNYVAWKAGAHPQLNHVFEPFAFFHDEDMIRDFPFLKRPLLRLLAASYKRLDVQGVRASAAVTTLNEGKARWIRKIYGREPELTFLGVDTEPFSPKSNGLRSRYAGRKVVIHSTDFTPLKRTPEAVDAIDRIRHAVPAVKLLITCSFADPRGVKMLEREIRARRLGDHVEFVGFVPHDQLPDYYSLADVFLYTGIGRGAGATSLFVLECMACGTPGVRTNFTGDEIEHGVSGFLYDPDDRRSLDRHLLELLRQDALRERFGQAARRRVVERYSWDATAERLRKTLLSLGGTSARSRGRHGRHRASNSLDRACIDKD